ncbi:MAG: GNAT family N-acetyltransferase [unclassified Hahellaceae]|nr:GNAT family N-acetyltransferase [Hahellaceae bacterium]
MVIEEANLSDVPDLIELQYRAYQSEAALHDDWSIPPLSETAYDMGLAFTENYFTKVIQDGRIVGSGRAKLADGQCFISKMAVEPELRGRGIGSCILRHLESRFTAVREFTLFTGEKSERNLKMYKNRGYREIDARLWVKRLSSTCENLPNQSRQRQILAVTPSDHHKGLVKYKPLI